MKQYKPHVWTILKVETDPVIYRVYTVNRLSSAIRSVDVSDGLYCFTTETGSKYYCYEEQEGDEVALNEFVYPIKGHYAWFGIDTQLLAIEDFMKECK